MNVVQSQSHLILMEGDGDFLGFNSSFEPIFERAVCDEAKENRSTVEPSFDFTISPVKQGSNVLGPSEKSLFPPNYLQNGSFSPEKLQDALTDVVNFFQSWDIWNSYDHDPFYKKPQTSVTTKHANGSTISSKPAKDLPSKANFKLHNQEAEESESLEKKWGELQQEMSDVISHWIWSDQVQYCDEGQKPAKDVCSSDSFEGGSCSDSSVTNNRNCGENEVRMIEASPNNSPSEDLDCSESISDTYVCPLRLRLNPSLSSENMALRSIFENHLLAYSYEESGDENCFSLCYESYMKYLDRVKLLYNLQNDSQQFDDKR